ncbi:MAG: cell division topological specificity factor MinE [Bacillota bacterium]
MGFTDILNRYFGRDSTSSKNVAKERLRLVLVHDRINVSPQVFEALKEDLIAVINKYMEIDQQALEVSFSSSDNSVALMANIPVVGIRRNT